LIPQSAARALMSLNKRAQSPIVQSMIQVKEPIVATGKIESVK
jgi:hypothetical protein